jgi:hypothetical protein
MMMLNLVPFSRPRVCRREVQAVLPAPHPRLVLRKISALSTMANMYMVTLGVLSKVLVVSHYFFPSPMRCQASSPS